MGGWRHYYGFSCVKTTSTDFAFSHESRKFLCRIEESWGSSAGISEYWLIDPIRQQAEFYRLGADNHYHLILLDEEGIHRSEVVRGFWLRVSWFWEEPLPPVWDVWQELSRQQ